MIRRLRSNRDGSAVVEFAIVAPIMLLLMMGMGELAFQAYVRSALLGAMQKAGRDSTIQGGAESATTIDDKVLAAVQRITPAATIDTPATNRRRSYARFGNIAPEPFVDTNNNNQRDAGECFTDVNGNGSWDTDPGRKSQGGASDVTVYTLAIRYPRLFPLATLLGGGSDQLISSTVLLKNQPYASQVSTTAATICT